MKHLKFTLLILFCVFGLSNATFAAPYLIQSSINEYSKTNENQSLKDDFKKEKKIDAKVSKFKQKLEKYSKKSSFWDFSTPVNKWLLYAFICVGIVVVLSVLGLLGISLSGILGLLSAIFGIMAVVFFCIWLIKYFS